MSAVRTWNAPLPGSVDHKRMRTFKISSGASTDSCYTASLAPVVTTATEGVLTCHCDLPRSGHTK